MRAFNWRAMNISFAEGYLTSKNPSDSIEYQAGPYGSCEVIKWMVVRSQIDIVAIIDSV